MSLELPAGLSHEAGVVCDVGCGIRPQELVNGEVRIAIEPHREYVDIVRSTNPDWIVIHDTWRVLKLFGDRDFDVLTALDVIEHLSRRAGYALIREVQRVAGQVIVFTPNGPFPQPKREVDQWGLNGGAWQEHHSAWTPADFDGWEIFELPGFHVVDAHGNKLKRPIGAFFAVWQ